MNDRNRRTILYKESRSGGGHLTITAYDKGTTLVCSWPEFCSLYPANRFEAHHVNTAGQIEIAFDRPTEV